MAATPFYLYNPPSCCHIHNQNQHNLLSPFLLLFFTLSFCSFTILILFLYTKLKYTSVRKASRVVQETQQQLKKIQTLQEPNVDNIQITQELDELDKLDHQSDPTHLTHSLLLEILPSNSPKWAKLFSNELGSNDPNKIDSVLDLDKEKRVKKKRVKKKRPDLNSEEEEVKKDCGVVKEKEELVCLYPFTKSSSATQRKIKQQYDELVKSHESNGLTLAQVGQFVNCLVEARNELQHKSEIIQRRFTITKALLFKADRSSFVRLRQQIYKLELEQKRLEEDAFVYNWLQQQLKLSPAYKKMLEIGADMEMKAKSSELVENTDAELPDISFEELLAQEKKDAFWQRNGRPKVYSS